MNNSMILVVEDDFAIRILIASTLEIEGYKYHVAKDGKQAIIEATTQNPELILPDLGLPDMDGVDVIKKFETGQPCQLQLLVPEVRIKIKSMH